MKSSFAKLIVYMGLFTLIRSGLSQDFYDTKTTQVLPRVDWVITTNKLNTNVWDEEAYMVATNSKGESALWVFKTTITNIPGEHRNMPKATLDSIWRDESSETNDIKFNHPESGGRFYRGSIYYEKNLENLDVSKTNIVTMMTFGDFEIIVIAVDDTGLVYCSTNFGASWKTFDKKGRYWFRLSYSPRDKASIFAMATIFNDFNSNNNQTSTNANWYSVGIQSNGGKLVLAGGSNSSPVLNISYLSNQIMLSWPGSFSNFVPQQNFDLSTTNWVTLTNTPILNSDNQQNEVIFSTTNNSGFFRLIGQ